MSRRSGIPLGCVVVMIPFALIWGGAQGLHEATAFPKPRVVSFAQFEKERPKEGWFTITSAAVTPLEASWMVTESSSTITESDSSKASGSDKKQDEPPPSKAEMAGLNELYLPVHREEEVLSSEKPVCLVLQTHNERIIHSLQQLASASREGGEHGLKQWMKKNLDRVWERRSFTGMLQVGINASTNTREELAKGSTLAPDFVILKEDERPQLGFAAAMLGAGVLMLLVPILMVVAACFRKPDKPSGPRVDEFVLPGSGSR